MKRCLRSALGFGLTVVILLAVAQAADQSTKASVTDPLIRVLINKGVLTEQEARSLTGTAEQQRDRLAQLLQEKGVISAAEFEALRTPPPASKQVNSSLVASVAPVLPPAQKTEAAPAAKPAAPAAPAVIPAIAPIRVLQAEGAKVGGLVPDIKLGSGAKMKLYGFFKTSVVHDTSVGQAGFANDFPLPGFLGDTGPSGAPEFHIKARGLRVGSNFEWADIAGSKAAITGRLEFDFEGNFTRTNNRNISSIRSSQPSLRLAWTRIDYPVSGNTNWYALFGQDWTPFGSSTLPNLLETTGLGIAFGSLYERDIQVRTGFLHNFGGSRSFKIEPDFAIVLPASGVPPGADNQLGYGERLGPDSAKPELQGRLMFQFQLDKAKGVAPAQLIVSGMNGWQRSIATAANVTASTAGAALKAAFAQGAEVETRRSGVTGEVQLPTRFVTVIGKAYTGSNLRWFFAGQLFSTFTDLGGLLATPGGAACTTATCGVGQIEGIAGNTVVVGFNSAGSPTIAPQRPIRAYGGFVGLGFPLSRIFNANPDGRNAGWTLNLHYGMDGAFARDIRRTTTAGARGKSDVTAANIQYKLNKFVTFGYEQSLYRTYAIRGSAAGTAANPNNYPIFRGLPAREWHDLRSEFATIFTF
jgi:hypothetical protein